MPGMSPSGDAEKRNTLFLRFIAILLITNSHSDALYPVAILASGGAVGNSLFFMLSGLGLALSSQKKALPRFGAWLLTRLIRIYPSLWIVALMIFLGKFQWKIWSGHEYITQLLYPTSFWFVSALIVFYMALFPVLKFGQATDKTKQWAWIGIFLIVPAYFYYYATTLNLTVFSIESAGYFKWLFYFQVMLFGVGLSSYYVQFKRPYSRDYWIFSVLTLFYIILKMVMSGHVTVFSRFLPFQFLVQWITLPMLYYALRIAKANWVSALFAMPGIGFFLSMTANCTLEIYLLQHALYSSHWIRQWAFPWNVVLFWLILLPLAFIVHLAAERVQNWLRECFQIWFRKSDTAAKVSG